MYLYGVNIGGYLSQVDEFTDEHLNTFITERDIKQIQTWGFNTIRMPVDYMLFEDDSHPFQYNTERIRHMDKIFGWANN